MDIVSFQFFFINHEWRPELYTQKSAKYDVKMYI